MNSRRFEKKNPIVMVRLSVDTKDKFRLVFRKQGTTLMITTSKNKKAVGQYSSDVGWGHSECHNKTQQS